MQRVCKQCGKEFTITVSEIKFYKSKNLTLPKRCKECRSMNRAAAGNDRAERKEKPLDIGEAVGKSAADAVKKGMRKSPIITGLVILAAVVAFCVYLFKGGDLPLPGLGTQPTEAPPTVSVTETVTGTVTETTTEKETSSKPAETARETEAQTAAQVTERATMKVRFRNEKLFNEHFKKHKDDTHSSSKEEYLQKANDLVNNPEALHKITNDGDTAYFLASTNEFAVLSSSGVLRTYFVCSGYDYFDRQ